MENEHPTARILARILGLMPAPGKVNSDEEASAMVWKMQKVVEEETTQQISMNYVDKESQDDDQAEVPF